ncbi:MAG: carbohydrate kinase family protein [Chloroflexia bacterium]
MKSYDVVIAGDVYCDLVFTGLPRLPMLGEELFATDFDVLPGGVFTTAATLHRLGLKVGLLCHTGNDPFSRVTIEAMEEEGLDLSLVQKVDRPMRTLTVAMSFREDRSFVSFADPRQLEPSPAEVLSAYRFRHLHVHWLGQLWDEPGLIELAREKGAGVSLDCQCCPEVMARADVPEKMGLVDVFLPNQVEALQVTGEADPEEALKKLAGWTQTVVVKLGAAGVIACHQGKHYQVAAMPVEVVDTTGAGDAFAGGFICGVLSGLPFEEALRAGAVCGGLSASARGGATKVPRLEELKARMVEGW